MSKVISGLLIAGLTVLLAVILDYSVGGKVLSRLDPHFTENRYRTHHPVYHHGFVPDFRTRYARWGSQFYDFCTDGNGFKVSCVEPSVTGTAYDIGIIGDSVTEAIGMTYEQSFVGQIAAGLGEKRVANLGVSSYSPAIYYSKIAHLLANGYTFDEIIVFVDISDIQDDAVIYRLDGTTVSGGRERIGLDKVSSLSPALEFTRRRLPLIYYSLRKLEAAVLGSQIHSSFADHEVTSRLEQRSSWTFRSDSPDYGEGGVPAAIEIAKANMQRLHDLLEEHKISLSVAVYPWPAQIRDDIENNLQVRVWEEFCRSACRQFYNLMPSFFERKADVGFQRTYSQFYIQGDIHFNEEGNAAVADQFLDQHMAVNP
ncbi:MAG: hypothetical protein NXI27_29125 [Alphaproteobacteria bacterium]|nr:hypothetical protein [Alphaproteobacteria bacterium]